VRHLPGAGDGHAEAAGHARDRRPEDRRAEDHRAHVDRAEAGDHGDLDREADLDPVAAAGQQAAAGADR
jgi:hypothetical protein